MSIYATIFTIQHPDDFEEAVAGAPIVVIHSEGSREREAELGSPWVYGGSHVMPSRDDPRGGFVELGAIAAFVEDARRGVPDEEHRGGDLPWVRLIVGTGPLIGRGDSATVVLDRPQAEALKDALDRWLGGLEEG